MAVEQLKENTQLDSMEEVTNDLENHDVSDFNLWTAYDLSYENWENKDKYERKDFDMWNIDFDWMYERTLNKWSKEVQDLLRDVLITNIFKWREIPNNLTFERTETYKQRKIIIHEWKKRYILTWEWNLRKYLITE